MDQNKRIISFDVMRVVAAYAVVFQHIGGQNWTDVFPSAEWEIRNIYVSFAQWSVPVFFMISGALFLSPDKVVHIKRLFGKNLLRIVYAFLFWSAVYELYSIGQDTSLKVALLSILKGPAHFWFLKVMIGIYLFVPVLKSVVVNRQAFRYLVLFSVITTFVVPPIFVHAGLFKAQWTTLLKDYYDGFGILSLEFISYFVLGYYLYSSSFGKRVKHFIYLLGIVGLIGSALCTHVCSHYLGYTYGYFYDDIHPFVMLVAVAVFVFAKEHCKAYSPSVRRVIVELSNYSLGIYLVHPLFMFGLNDYFSINSSTFNPVFSVPVLATFIFLLSYLLVKVVSYIPYLKKTVV